MAVKIKQLEKEELSKTELKILQSFFPKGKDLTLKEIMNISGYSYEPVYRTVQGLVNKKIISVKKFGKTLVYDLDFKKEASKIAFILYAIKKSREFFKKHQTIFSALSEIPEYKTDIIVIFGSYAKGNQHERSDIDILCVASETEDIKSKIFSLKHAYNKNFSPIIIHRNEFAKIKTENKEFWQDLIEYGIIFKGYELFYYYAYLK